MSTPGYIVTANADYWIRVNLAVEVHLKQALLNILHNADNDPTYQGLPKDGKLLYGRMVLFKQAFKKKLHKVLKKDQWDMLCDHTTGVSDSQQWDVTLIVVVIINELKLPPPQNGWTWPPAANDKSKAAFVLIARHLRNIVKHGSLKDFSTIQQFDCVWKQIKSALTDVKYQNIKDFDELETRDLEFYTSAAVNVMKVKCHDLEKDIKQCQDDQKHLQQDTSLVSAARKQEIDQLSAELHNEIQGVKDILHAFQIASRDKNLEHEKVEERLKHIEKFLIQAPSMKEHDVVLEEVIDILILELDTRELLVFSEQFRVRSYCCSWCCKCCRDLNHRLKEKRIKFDELTSSLFRSVKENSARKRILDRLGTETKLTLGFDQAVYANQQQMSDKFNKYFSYKPFLDINGDLRLARNVPYVDLSYQIQQDENYEGEEALSSRRSKPTATDLRGIITASDELVVITGISGIGKSSMINQLIVKWCQNEIWRREPPKIDMIFNIKCSTLNTLDFTGDRTTEDIFISLFPTIFKTTSIEVMKVFKNKLLIIDGFDELEGFRHENQRNIDLQSSFSFVRYIITKSEVFGFEKTIITTSFKSHASLKRLLDDITLKVKFVEVKGFSEENMKMYMNKVSQNKTEVKRLLSFEASFSGDFSEIARVPAYLSIMCDLNDGNNSALNPPKSVTELLLYSLLAFYRKHSKKVSQHLSMNEIIESDGFITVMKHFSHIAFKRASIDDECCATTHENGRLLSFWNGIIKVTRQGEYGAVVYQFQHSMMEKLFCSIHLFQKSSEERQIILGEASFRPCWRFAVEIERILRDPDSCDILKNFLSKLGCRKPEKNNYLRYSLSDNVCKKSLITLKDIEDEFKLFSGEYLPRIDENTLMPKLMVDFSEVDNLNWDKVKGILNYILSISKKNVHSFYCGFSSMIDEIELCGRLLQRAQNIHLVLDHVTSIQQERIINSCLSMFVVCRGGENVFLRDSRKVYITNPKWYSNPWRFGPNVLGKLPDGLFQLLPLINDLTLRSINGSLVDQIVAALSTNMQILEIEECSFDKDSTVFHHLMRIESVFFKTTVVSHSHLPAELLHLDENDQRVTQVNKLKYLALHYCNLDWKTLELLLEVAFTAAVEVIDILNYRSLDGSAWLLDIATIYVKNDLQDKEEDVKKKLPRFLTIRDRFNGIDLKLQLVYDDEYGMFNVIFWCMELNNHTMTTTSNTTILRMVYTYSFCRQIDFVHFFGLDPTYILETVSTWEEYGKTLMHIGFC